MPKKNLIWLASYPKSGNTWFRIVLSHLLANGREVDINNLERTPIASSRELFDEYSPIMASDLSHSEIDNMRPLVYRTLSENVTENTFLKVHDAYVVNKKGDSLFPSEISLGAIYVIRNPLDVVASFANHLNRSIDRTIEIMNNPAFAFAGGIKGLPQQLKQQMGSWSDHVNSWTNQNQMPVHVIRYEDMLDNPFHVFKKALEFAGLRFSDEQLSHAIARSSFDNISKAEQQDGFKERPLNTDSFFRKGKKGGYKEELSEQQIAIIVENHRDIMRKFRYLP